jgi:hypothetical protein
MRLRAFTVREDADKYKAMLITVLGLFGKGIISSLEYTMKDYLKQTRGHLRTEEREEWEIKKCKAMLCHNNHAERPFAVLRQYNRLYPSLSLPNLSKLSQSLVNGTHRPGVKGVEAGIALTADPRLRTIIGVLCSVRQKKVTRPLHTHEIPLHNPYLPTHVADQVGKITRYMREE